jgi:uncharacterized membrane protein YbhN (UPF0104 family)
MVKRWLPWLIKGGVSIGLIGWLLSKIDLGAAFQQAKTVDPRMAALSVGLMLVQVLLGAVRWGMVLRALSGALTAVRTLKIYYIGVFFAMVLPGAAVGGDAVRIYFTRKAGLELGSAIGSVMLERAVTVLGLVLLVAATQPLLIARVPDIPGTWVFPVLLVVCIVGILVLSQLDRTPDSLRHWRVVRGLASLAADTRRLFFSPAWGGGTLAVAVIGHINLSLAAWVLALGLRLDVGAVDCLVLIPPVILTTILPISIGGWGVREGAMVTAFGFIGVAHESALVLSVLFAVVGMVTALPGGLVFLLSGEHRPAPAELEAGKLEV